MGADGIMFTSYACVHVCIGVVCLSTFISPE